MRPRDPSAAIEDAVLAGEAIASFLGDATAREYASNRLLASAVERQFEILGEALCRALRANPLLPAHIPEIHEVIGFRNVLAHGYDVVDDETVYNNARQELPAMIGRLSALLDEDEV